MSDLVYVSGHRNPDTDSICSAIAYSYLLNATNKYNAVPVRLGEINRETEKDEVLKIYRSHKPNIHLYDGVAKMIEELKRKGIKVGIITDGRPEGQRNKLEALGLDQMVDDIVITDELGGVQFRKPCDIAFRIMITRWRMNPADVIYVGDNPVKDFQAPKQLGMKWILYKNADGLYTSSKENGISSMEEIKNCLMI